LSQSEKNVAKETGLLQVKANVSEIREYVTAVSAEFKISEEYALALITQRELALLNGNVTLLISLLASTKKRSGGR
jgi:hypothetical protein